MKKIRTLLVQFDNELSHYEVSAFRGAVIEKVGRENILFNHHLDDTKYLFKYPLIQYKSIRKRPAVLCLGEGVEEIHKLFNQSTWGINLKGNKVDLKIDKLDLGNFTLNVWDKSEQYRLFNWIALNGENFKRFTALENEMEKLEMLEKILVGNILSFAKGIGWDVEKEIKVRINKTERTKSINYKNTRLLAFDIEFSTNAFLPNNIGLGKGVSHGYGIVRKVNKKEKNE